MSESIVIALEVYFIGFTISILIAALIKGMHGILRRLTPEKEIVEEEK